MNPKELMLQEHEQLDDLQNGYFILQSREGFRFGLDAVLVAHFAEMHTGAHILDLGCGNGIIPLLIAARKKDVHVTGLEIQKQSAELARRSVKYNQLEDRIDIIEGDIKEVAKLFKAASFDSVISNPPYMLGEHGLKNPREEMAIARHEILCDFSDIAAAAEHLLPNLGRFFLVHRPFRLAELFRILTEHHLEPKRMRLVFPYADREPNMVLIEARKGGRSRMMVERPLIVYEKPGVYTEEILKIYGRSI